MTPLLRALAPFPFVLGLALAAPLAAAAAEPMTAEEFDAYATGKTLSYALGDEIWGTEQYLPGRRVIWAFSQDECQYGTWYPQGDEICFVYDNDPTPQCWTFWQQGGGLRARFAGDPAGTELAEVGQSSDPLVCPGPDVGA
jgi:hypothetical protein